MGRSTLMTTLSSTSEAAIAEKMRPLHDLVLVRRDAPVRSRGGLLLPQQNVEGSPTARVLAAGKASACEETVGRRVVLTTLGRRIQGTDLWVVAGEHVAMVVDDDLDVDQPKDQIGIPFDEEVA